MTAEIPKIGDLVISPHDKAKSETGEDRFNLLVCNGENISVSSGYPLLKNILPSDFELNGDTHSLTNLYYTTGTAVKLESTYLVGLMDGSTKLFEYDSDFNFIGSRIDLSDLSNSLCYIEGSNFYAMKWNSRTVKEVAPDGSIVSSRDISHDARLMAYDGTNLWFCDVFTQMLRRYDTDFNYIGPTIDITDIASPQTIGYDGGTGILVEAASHFYRIDGETFERTHLFYGNSDGNDNPKAVVLSLDNDVPLYVF